jgi:hypothetical protein
MMTVKSNLELQYILIYESIEALLDLLSLPSMNSDDDRFFLEEDDFLEDPDFDEDYGEPLGMPLFVLFIGL